jgi:hypothetical protein
MTDDLGGVCLPYVVNEESSMMIVPVIAETFILEHIENFIDDGCLCDEGLILLPSAGSIFFCKSVDKTRYSLNIL